MNCGWIKMHMCVEVRSVAVFGLAVSEDKAGDAQYMPALLEQAACLLTGPDLSGAGGKKL